MFQDENSGSLCFCLACSLATSTHGALKWRPYRPHPSPASFLPLLGNPRLDGKVVRLQREFRSISTTKFTDPKTKAATYSYKMGKVRDRLDKRIQTYSATADGRPEEICYYVG